MLVTVILFLVILLALVLVHEFGHFIAAKYFKMRVDEFAFGFPPRLFSIKRGETEYSFNALPIGGYVKIFGESEISDGSNDKDKARSFGKQAFYKQFIVLLAGVTMNIILAWLLFTIVFTSGTTIVQDKYTDGTILTNKSTTVTGVLKGGPADRVGVVELDKINKLAVSGSASEISLPSSEQVTKFVRDNQNSKITITLERNGETLTREVVPELNTEAGFKVIGISSGTTGRLKLPLLQASLYSIRTTYGLTIATFEGFLGLFTKLFTFKGGEAVSALAGPIGIIPLVSGAQSEGVIAILTFTALLSINLAVLNILPLPALDGGRIVLLVVEKIKGSAVSLKKQNIINIISFGFLLLLMLIVTVNDIIKIL